jgi:predicted dehydrogenase
MKPIRIAVIGCGEIAQVMHLPFLTELPQFEVAAICDLSPTVLEQVGDRYNVPIRSQSFEDVLDHVEAVAILTHEHATIAQAAAAKGKHIFVEKPLSLSVTDCDSILDAVRENGVKLMVGYMKRYDPGYLYALDRISKLASIGFVRLHDFGGSFRIHPGVYTLYRGDDVPADEINSLQQRIRETMLGALGTGRDHLVDVYFEMLMSGIHDLTVLRGILGQAESVLHSEALGAGGLVSLLDYGQGRMCVFEAALMTEHSWWDQNVVVYGTDAVVSIEFPNPFIRYAPSVIRIQENDGETPVQKTVPVSHEAAFRREWLHFADCLRNDKPPLTNGEDAKADVELALAMVQAAT